ncbi:hypothetical protein AB6D11_25460 [Vibrio splendidus]
MSVWNGNALLDQVITQENHAVLGVVWNDDYRVEVVARDDDLESKAAVK